MYILHICKYTQVHNNNTALSIKSIFVNRNHTEDKMYSNEDNTKNNT